MLSEEKLRTLPQPAQAYWRKAQEFVTKNQVDWFMIVRGSEEWTAWSRYFSSFNYRPFGMRSCDSIAVPAQWPEWLDHDYKAPSGHSALTEPQRRERYENTERERYGANVRL